MATTMQVAKLSHQGRVRDQNEDFCEFRVPNSPDEIASKGALFVVADGMGGHEAGRAASQWAVTILLERYYAKPATDIATALREAVQAANAEVRELAIRNHWSNAGTTLVCAVLRGNELTVANVGDSRAYLVREGEAKQITEDHTWVHERVKAGDMTPEQAASDQRRHAITRSLGSRPNVVVDVFPVKLEEGDALVLCTDGLTGPSYGPGPVSDAEIARIVGHSRSPEEATKQLVDLANQRGGPDNITTIVIYNGRHRSVAGASSALRPMAIAGAVGLVALLAVVLGAFALFGSNRTDAGDGSTDAPALVLSSKGGTPSNSSAAKGTATAGPSSTIAATSTQPPTSTPAARETPAVGTATPVSTPRQVADPKTGETPGPATAYSAPTVQGPETAASFSSRSDVITLRWSLPQGLQGDKDLFHVYIRVVDKPSLDVNHYTRDTSYQVPAHLFGESSKFEWYVVPWRQTGSNPGDGADAGPRSVTRTFQWAPSPGEPGSNSDPCGGRPRC